MVGRREFLTLAWAGVIFLAPSGCAFGPKVLEQTHGRYYEAVRRVDQEELLRNIVHTRYIEVPGSLDVASITAQYELAASAEAKPFFEAPNPSGDVFKTFAAILPDVALSATQRPTVSLHPTMDSETMRRFLTPISLETLQFL